MLRHLGVIGVLALLAACGQAPGASSGAVNTATAANNAGGAANFSKPDPTGQRAAGGGTTPATQAATGGGQTQQASISSADRAELEALIGRYLDAVQQRGATGMSQPAGFSDEITSLQPGQDYRWAVDLAGGTAYRIVGSCDNECSNVDIELVNGQGAVVASDVLPDDFPIVDFTPPSNGRYVVRIIMRTCTVAPCFTGARVLTAGGGGGKKT